jgi:hypothetical protein
MNMFSQHAHFNRGIGHLAWLGISVLAIVFHTAADAAPRATDNPANNPKAIVEALIGRDFRDMSRYTGGNELFEYKPIFESYPAYDIEKLKDSSGKTITREATPTFGKCTQEMLVKDIKVTKVQYAQDPTKSVNQPKSVPYEVYVTVQAEVLALRLFNPDKIPADRACSWLGLEVKNTKTGKREAYFDNADDGDALLKMMKQFGAIHGDYVLIDPHRREWSYGINLLLPKSGKGLGRHYDNTLPIGQRKYVDAVEPLWLVQDPYPPPAIYLETVFKKTLKDFHLAHDMAFKYCQKAIERETGVSPSKPDFDHHACGVGSGTQTELDLARRFDLRLQTLRRIK